MDKSSDEGSKRRLPLGDSIEIESDDVTPSQEQHDDHQCDSEALSSAHEDLAAYETSPASSPLSERERKRRKVTASPMSGSSPPAGHDHLQSAPSEEDEPSRHTTPIDSSNESIQDVMPTRNEPKAIQQPTFQAPPRFKPIETDPAFEGLPAAFSPQRRGAKYIAGGLAAELQGWLSDIKGWEGSAASSASTTRLVVDQISPGPRMYLAEGHVDGQLRRFLLAGQGKLTGLGRRAVVGIGSVVDVDQPVWDVELEGHVWTVVCDWSVHSID